MEPLIAVPETEYVEFTTWPLENGGVIHASIIGLRCFRVPTAKRDKEEATQ